MGRQKALSHGRGARGRRRALFTRVMQGFSMRERPGDRSTRHPFRGPLLLLLQSFLQMATSATSVQSRSRPSGPDAAHAVPARPALRRARRRAVRRGRERRDDRGDRRRASLFGSSSCPTSSRSPRWAPRRSRPQEAPGLHAMIERLCIQADLPKPKIAVADTAMPNAFAIGRSQKSATVCATTGIMQRCSPAELEGVMAHELTHVKNRDVLIMTIACFFAALAVDDRAVRLLLRRRRHGRRATTTARASWSSCSSRSSSTSSRSS